MDLVDMYGVVSSGLGFLTGCVNFWQILSLSHHFTSTTLLTEMLHTHMTHMTKYQDTITKSKNTFSGYKATLTRLCQHLEIQTPSQTG